MIYDNKLHKKLKTFLQHLSTWWDFFSKNFLPVVEFLNKKSSGPEDIPGGGMVTDTGQDDTYIR